MPTITGQLPQVDTIAMDSTPGEAVAIVLLEQTRTVILNFVNGDGSYSWTGAEGQVLADAMPVDNARPFQIKITDRGRILGGRTIYVTSSVASDDLIIDMWDV